VRVGSAFGAVFLTYLFALYWIESFIVLSASIGGKNMCREKAWPISSKSESILRFGLLVLAQSGSAFFLSTSKSVRQDRACKRRNGLAFAARENDCHRRDVVAGRVRA
jgi:hypothetical protein